MMHQASRAAKRAITPKKPAEQLQMQQNDIEKALNLLNLYNRPDNHRIDLRPSAEINTNNATPPPKAKIS